MAASQSRGELEIAPPAYTLEARADILVSLLDRLSFCVADAVTDSAEAVVESVQAPVDEQHEVRTTTPIPRFWKHSPGFVNPASLLLSFAPARPSRELGRGCARRRRSREPATISKPLGGFMSVNPERALTSADHGSRHPYFFSSSQVYAGEPVMESAEAVVEAADPRFPHLPRRRRVPRHCPRRVLRQATITLRHARRQTSLPPPRPRSRWRRSAAARGRVNNQLQEEDMLLRIEKRVQQREHGQRLPEEQAASAEAQTPRTAASVWIQDEIELKNADRQPGERNARTSSSTPSATVARRGGEGAGRGGDRGAAATPSSSADSFGNLRRSSARRTVARRQVSLRSTTPRATAATEIDRLKEELEQRTNLMGNEMMRWKSQADAATFIPDPIAHGAQEGASPTPRRRWTLLEEKPGNTNLPRYGNTRGAIDFNASANDAELRRRPP